MSAKSDMLAGEWYNANYDAKLITERMFAKDLCFELNNTSLRNSEIRLNLLGKILPNVDVVNVEILSPFMVDYGYNIEIGAGSFFNHNIYLMDCAKITFGKHCFIGPNCNFYTAIHPLEVEERNEGYEIAKPIEVGDNVWIAGDVTVMPGISIGSHSVIGAKSLVTKNIPEGVLAFGNPCKIIRKISE